MRTPRLVLLTGAAALLFGACGGGSVALEDVPDELVKTLCEQQVACNTFPDVDTCIAATDIADTNVEEIQADIDSGAVRYDADLFDDCLGAVEDFFNCRLQLSGAALDELARKCTDYLVGTVAEGDACSEDLQCAGDAECEVPACPDECCVGTCVADPPEPVAQIGEDCTNNDCVGGAFCDRTGTSPVCADRLAVGQACAACVDGALCDFNFTTQSGNCIALAEQGDSCDPSTNLGIACVRTDNFCDPADSVCRVRLDVGETCSPNDDNCRSFAICQTDSCVQRPAAGEDCVVGGEVDCLGSLECVAGTCQLETDIDAYCTLEADV